MHGRFRIANDDYFYVLSTFGTIRSTGWRPPARFHGQGAGLAALLPGTRPPHGHRRHPRHRRRFRAFRDASRLSAWLCQQQPRGLGVTVVSCSPYLPRPTVCASPACRHGAVRRSPDRGHRRKTATAVVDRAGGGAIRSPIVPQPVPSETTRRITRRRNPTYPNHYTIRRSSRVAPRQLKPRPLLSSDFPRLSPEEPRSPCARTSQSSHGLTLRGWLCRAPSSPCRRRRSSLSHGLAVKERAACFAERSRLPASRWRPRLSPSRRQRGRRSRPHHRAGAA